MKYTPADYDRLFAAIWGIDLEGTNTRSNLITKLDAEAPVAYDEADHDGETS